MSKFKDIAGVRSAPRKKKRISRASRSTTLKAFLRLLLSYAIKVTFQKRAL